MKRVVIVMTALGLLLSGCMTDVSPEPPADEPEAQLSSEESSEEALISVVEPGVADTCKAIYWCQCGGGLELGIEDCNGFPGWDVCCSVKCGILKDALANQE